MPPRKQPDSLFRICIEQCILLINKTCRRIDKKYSEKEFRDRQRQAAVPKSHLMRLLPARLFDVLCSERTCFRYKGDPRVQLSLLMHPEMTKFRKCYLDDRIPEHYWIDALPSFSKLVILNLKLICTNEILETISISCPLLEELNAVAREDTSPTNSSVFIKNVCDIGLSSIAKLKQLRVVYVDTPINLNQSNIIGRRVTPEGIMMLVKELPRLEELHITSWDFGLAVSKLDLEFGPLSLSHINYYFITLQGIQNLIKLCPNLKIFSVTNISHDERVLDQISQSDLLLTELNVAFYSYDQSVEQLLMQKGSYLTHFDFWERDMSLTIEAVLVIGVYCPNLSFLNLVSESKEVLPQNFKQVETEIFTKLTVLSLGSDIFCINHLLPFFLKYAPNLQKLVLSYYYPKGIEEVLLFCLQENYLKTITNITLTCVQISKSVAKKIIDGCENMRSFVALFKEDLTDLRTYIRKNNLDVYVSVCHNHGRPNN